MNKLKHIERKWLTQEKISIPSNLRALLPYPDLILQTLVGRGYSTPDCILKFIDYTRYTPASPFDLPDMEKGVQRIAGAIRQKERIGVWGDFDVDGQTSTAILMSALRDLNADSVYHIPIRGPETHGIGMPALREFLKSGVRVILTCDTGISAHESIAYAKSMGIDVVVTDHHLLPETLPPAYALINPRRLPDSHPLSTLPGAGVAYKFAEALLGKFGQINPQVHLHDLAALGIVADLADLYGDARYLAQSGISQLRASPRPALAAILESAEVDPSNLSEEQISFIIAPRLNAVGRLSDAYPIVEFLLSRDPGEIAVTVNRIEGLNNKRKLLCDQVFSGAQSLIEQNRAVLNHAVLVLHHPDWPAGVVGIVASRLVEIYHRPVILLSGPPGHPLRGSARSVEGIDITAALRLNEARLLNYGGHPMAAGLSLNEENLPALVRGLDAAVSDAEIDPKEMGVLLIDHALYPAEVTLDLARSLDLLAPFGPGNPPLVFRAEGMRLVNTRPVGKLGEHLLVDVDDPQGNTNRFIWWNGSGLLLPEGKFDLAYTPRASNYHGEDQVSLEWIDYRQASDEIDLITEEPSQSWVNIDHRRSPLPLDDLRNLLTDPETLVWVEGTVPAEIQGVNRLGLHPCRNLVIWTPPPEIKILKEILESTTPERVFWFLVSPPEHQLKQFLLNLAGLVKAALSQGQNELSLSALASDVAASESTTTVSIRWLASKGTITITDRSSGKIRAKLGGTPDPQEQKQLEYALSNTFRELKAFTRFLQQTDLDRLTTDLG